MKTFVLMSKHAAQGPSIIEVVSRLKRGPEARRSWIDQIEKQCPEVNFIAHYALLGGWDFMDIYEAPDEESAAKVSMICSASSAYRVESWVAIPEKRIEELAAEVKASIDDTTE